ncbi:hypothetical protein ACH5RR_012660 [Cinchona calisaya]|uniref:Uncharacterized protein n=1 Tax=Cinchona calisaya TaxID=153742 RepID=A0ABD3A9V7_9GENT
MTRVFDVNGALLHQFLTEDDLHSLSDRDHAILVTFEHEKQLEEWLNSNDWNPRLILDKDNSYLVTLPSLEEVKEVVYSLSSNSIAGVDGLNGVFFKSCSLVRDFFNGEGFPDLPLDPESFSRYDKGVSLDLLTDLGDKFIKPRMSKIIFTEDLAEERKALIEAKEAEVDQV